PALRARAEIVHCDVSISMAEKPSVALRTGRRTSSMWKALEAVRDGSADAAVSAGNTGALMAMAKFCVRPIAGLGRPALAARWPTLSGECIVLDLGASIGADADHLVDMAILGAAMARALYRRDRPRVGLLNIGAEEVKGLAPIQEAGKRLRAADLPFLDYAGFVEADGIGKGAVDVVVSEGFAGNIALKSAEGTARQVGQYLREAFEGGLRGRLAYLLLRPALERMRAKADPRRVNGGVFLGLDGVVIKSHGGADPEAMANAIRVGADMAREGLTGKIKAMLDGAGAARAASEGGDRETPGDGT
ncbi:MAG: phosphate acyltransferase PlsX, partial [Hyphomicrobiales bacterium]|nr:phosphate acyltransferase PlsX [Hyphomicrobiales bacterium]